MDAAEASYIVRFYSQLLTMTEHLAHRHLTATAKATRGRTDALAQAELRGSAHHLRKLLSSDPEVLRLSADGWEGFVQRTGERLLAEHRDQIFLNYCPRCGLLARTPTARQCRGCKLDWHQKKP